MASISGIAWLDENLNGLKDSLEPGVPEIKVSLHGLGQADGQVIKTVETDFDGNYSFTGLTAGEYYLVFQPLASEFSLIDRESYIENKKAVESIANSFDGRSQEIVLKTNENRREQNVGIFIDSYDKVLGAVAEDNSIGNMRPTFMLAQVQSAELAPQQSVYQQFASEKTSPSVWAIALVFFSLAALVQLLLFLDEGRKRRAGLQAR